MTGSVYEIPKNTFERKCRQFLSKVFLGIPHICPIEKDDVGKDVVKYVVNDIENYVLNNVVNYIGNDFVNYTVI